MKKIFIGLLIIAVGAGAYFLLQAKKKSLPQATGTHELLPGKWKLDSFAVHPHDSAAALALGIAAFLDSNFMQYRYDITGNGQIVVTTDSINRDTAFYEWKKSNQLAVKGRPADAKADFYAVSRLTADTLILFSADSTSFVFTRAK